MDWNRVEGNWKQMKGKVKEQWGKLTDDDLDQIAGKQDQLAAMLGVGRSYISRVIRSLKERGIVETKRGRICVRNEPALSLLTCHCNQSVKRHFDEVLSGVYPIEDESTGQRTSEIIAAE